MRLPTDTLRRSLVLASALTCLSLHALSAQEKEKPKDPPPTPGGTVTGRVLFADTGGPARFAKVFLKSTAAPTAESANPFANLFGNDDDDAKPSKSAPAKPKLTPEQEADKKKSEAAAAQMFAALSDMLVSTTIGADGVYLFTNVKPGTYYVHAVAPGYIDPFTQFSAADLASTDPAMRARIAAIPTVTVAGTAQGKADMRLERGGSVSGRVLYDDGTPAAGWVVRTVHEVAAAANGMADFGVDAGDLDLAHATEVSTTDDTGRFRIAGLATGDYVLQARLSVGVIGYSSFNASAGMGAMLDRMGSKITVFSGNATRRSQAKPVSLTAGNETSGYDITVPLRQEHAIAGLVRAKSDGHPINSGTVALAAVDAQGAEDPSLHLTATIREDGTFHFDYVPGPGTFTLKVQHAADVTTLSTKKILGSNMATQKTDHSYGPATSTITLGEGDITDLKLEVPEVAK